MRKLGINFETVFFPGMNEQDGLSLLRAAGFDSFFTDYYFNETILERYAQAVVKNGIRWESMHAPFEGPLRINSIWEEGEQGDVMLDRLIQCVRACHRFNVPVAVIHLSSGMHPPCVGNIGRKRLDKLVEEAVCLDVTLGFENLRKVANLAFVLELYDDVPQVGFCWDVGHEACFTPGKQFMPLFGNKLVFTHIHDNMCMFNGDDHMIPFEGAIDFERVACQLRESGFQGTLSLELLPYASGRYEGIAPEEYYARAYTAACRLRDMIDG